MQKIQEETFIRKRFALSRRDLLIYEEIVCNDLKSFLSFDSHVLYFPVEDELRECVFVREEEKLLVPLRYHGALLGILLLKGVRCTEQEEQFLSKILSSVTEICLQKIHGHKKERLDERSGLLVPRIFMEKVRKEVLAINTYFQQTIQSDMLGVLPDRDIVQPVLSELFSSANGMEDFGERHNDFPVGPHIRQSSIGLMVLPVLGLDTLRQTMGYHAAEGSYAILAEKIRRSIPADAYCTLLDDDNFAVLFSGANRRMMDNLAHDCLAIEEFVPFDAKKRPFYKEKGVTLRFCAGYALFPQDWDGTTDSRAIEEVPHLLLHKARITAKRLQGAQEKHTVLSAEQSLAYKQILLHGGSVTGIDEFSKIQVDLGRENGAYEGMCFRVVSHGKGSGAKGMHDRQKGEIILRKVYKNHSEAEILLLDDPTVNISTGDRLFYVSEHALFLNNLIQNAVQQAEIACYSYQDFVNAVNTDIAKEQFPEFSLSLLFLNWQDNEYATGLEHGDILEEQENFMQRALTLFADYLLEHGQKKGIYSEQPLFASLSYNSILVYHKKSKAGDLRKLYEDALQYLENELSLEKAFDGAGKRSVKRTVKGAVGLCSYPYLNYSPAEMWEGVRKALNYALLLPAPHVGILDSLAINISADRKFSLGDTFGAVEEYRMALLADSDNVLAWNSLGVCLADLGRHAEAKNAFEVAYSKNNKDFSTCYNLGTTCMALEDKKSAKEFFLAGLALKPDHVYARIRLGEIAEKEGDLETARQQYLLAMEADKEKSVSYRCLARIYLQEKDYEKAREYLQTALHKNGDDAISMQLFAGLVLDSNEDAKLAEILARQSIALAPYRRSAWGELARALDVQGRKDEAMEIRRSSMRLN